MKHRDDFSLWVQYKQVRNNFSKTIRIAKKLAWKSFTEDVSNMEGMLKVSRAILQKRQPQVGHLIKRDGTYTQTRGVLVTLHDEFFLDSTELRVVQTSPLLYVSKNDIPDLFFLGNLKSPSNPLKRENLLDWMGLKRRSFKTWMGWAWGGWPSFIM